MKRRSILSAAGWLAWTGLGYASSRAADQPVHKVSIEQLQRVIAGHFPARYPVGNLVNLEVEAPRLRLLPELNRLASEMVLHAAGPSLRRSYRGSFDVDFALRYEPSDQSIRAHELRMHSFRLPGLRHKRFSCSRPMGRPWRSRRCSKSCSIGWVRAI